VVDKRPVSVRQITGPQQARACQIFFVSVSERKRARALMGAAKRGSVLTLWESDAFRSGGGVIEFRVEESKVRMEISVYVAKRAGLRVSAKSLSPSQPRK
jgi:hypothetical protein